MRLCSVGSLGDRAAMLCVVVPTDFASLDLFVVWQRRQIALLVNAAVCVCLGDHDSVPDESHAARSAHCVPPRCTGSSSTTLCVAPAFSRRSALTSDSLRSFARWLLRWRRATLPSTAGVRPACSVQRCSSVWRSRCSPASISSVSPFTGAVEAPSVAESPSGMPLGYARLADDFDDVEALLDAHVASYSGRVASLV
jgi:hypothetical protein